MNSYTLILSDRTEDALAATYQKCEAALRPVSQRIVRIQPHLLLVQSDLDMDALAQALRIPLAAHDNWLLLEIRRAWRGASLVDRSVELQRFFYIP
jgi:hypothetical protein